MTSTLMMMDPVHSAMDNSFGQNHHTVGYNFKKNRHEFRGYEKFGTTNKSETRQGDEPHLRDLKCVIYVGYLNPSMNERSLRDVFSQFGTVVSIARRPFNFDEYQTTEHCYAFIRFSTPQEAEYAVQVGEVELQGQKLVIKPRDRKQRVERQPYHRQSEKPQYHEEQEDTIPILTHDSRAHIEGPKIEPQLETKYDARVLQSKLSNSPQKGQGSSIAPVLMSKNLRVSNLPADMSPRELYFFFLELGECDSIFIYPQLDSQWRRFALVEMGTFFLAQKALETFNGYNHRGSTLEVMYWKDPPPPVSAAIQQEVPLMKRTQHISHTFMPIHAAPTAQPSMNWQQQYANICTTLSPQIPQGYVLTTPPGMPYTGFSSGLTPVFQNMDAGQSVYGVSNSPQGQPHISHGVHHPRFRNQRMFSPGSQSNQHSSQSQSVSSWSEAAHRLSSSGSNTTVLTHPQMNPHERFYDSQSRLHSPISDEQSFHYSMNKPKSPTLQEFEIMPATIIPETVKPVDPCNLFIKNLDDKVISNSEELKKLFEHHGTVTSAHLATISGTDMSKGFGFVAFGKPEEAAKAKEELNNSLVGRKRVFVSYAERKEDRVKRLKSFFEGKPLENDSNDMNEQKTQDDGHQEGGSESLEKEKPPIEEKVTEISENLANSKIADTGCIVPDCINGNDGSVGTKPSHQLMRDNKYLIGDLAPRSEEPAVELKKNVVNSERYLFRLNSASEEASVNSQEIAIAATLASVKGWPSTVLSNILEVDEEEIQPEGSKPADEGAGPRNSKNTFSRSSKSEISETPTSSPPKMAKEASLDKESQKINATESRMETKTKELQLPNQSKLNSKANSKIPIQSTRSEGPKGRTNPNQIQGNPTKKRRNFPKNRNTKIALTGDQKQVEPNGISVVAH